jgi:hypothetical protein
MRDVHEFDGKFRIEKLEHVKDEEEKNAVLQRFSERHLAPHVRMMWELLLQRHDPQNYDPIAACHALDILLSLLKKIPRDNEDEWFVLLEEQLADMVRLGSCPQGRTTRLWQLHACLL